MYTYLRPACPECTVTNTHSAHWWTSPQLCRAQSQRSHLIQSSWLRILPPDGRLTPWQGYLNEQSPSFEMDGRREPRSASISVEPAMGRRWVQRQRRSGLERGWRAFLRQLRIAAPVITKMNTCVRSMFWFLQTCLPVRHAYSSTFELSSSRVSMFGNLCLQIHPPSLSHAAQRLIER